MASYDTGHYRDLENLIKEAIAEDIEATRVPPPPRQFEAIIANLETQRGKKRLKTLVKRGLLAASLILLLSAGLYQVFPDKLAEAGRKLLNTISYIFVDTPDSESYHPYLENSDARVLQELLKARERAPFEIKLPTYLPGGYVLSEVTPFNEINNSRLSLYFQKDGSQIRIDQEMVSTTTVSILKNSNRESSKKVSVLQYEGMLVTHDSGVIFLSFVADNHVHYMVIGELAEAELIKIAASLLAISN